MYMECRVIISFVMLLFAKNIYCETISQYDTDEIIDIILQDESKNNNEDNARSLSQIPISCYYNNGYFTIPTNVTLTMRKPYRIYVMDGATLNIEGGQIVNADIVIKNGGSINISNEALIEIREQGGNLNLENGAILNYIKGTIR